MSIQMNIGDHISPHAGWVTVPNEKRGQVRWARTRAKKIARDFPSANVDFRNFPGRRSLTALLDDRTIWMNYDPAAIEFGAQSIAHPKEIAIGPSAFRVGRWIFLATLMQELAHVDVAPGGGDRRAEEALLHTGLGSWKEFRSGRDNPATPYDPTISG